MSPCRLEMLVLLCRPLCASPSLVDLKKAFREWLKLFIARNILLLSLFYKYPTNERRLQVLSANHIVSIVFDPSIHSFDHVRAVKKTLGEDQQSAKQFRISSNPMKQNQNSHTNNYYQHRKRHHGTQPQAPLSSPSNC